MSFSEASFIAALVATGGIVAWIGDVVGYRLGKRRVSLFGIRPRTTAVIVGILSGALISTVTIAALSLTSKHVRTALFDMDRLDAELQDRKDQIEKQREQIERHKQAVDEAEQRRAEAEQREAEALADVAKSEIVIEQKRRSLATFRADLARVRQLQEQTEAQNQELEQKAAELERAIQEAEGALEGAQRLLARNRAMLAYVSGGFRLAHYEDPIIEAQEELARAVLDTTQPTENIRADVVELLEQASEYAAGKGAQTGDNDRAVFYLVLPTSSDSGGMSLPEPEAIDQFVSAKLNEPHKSHAVRVLARFNTWRGERAGVILDSTPNRLVFAQGDIAGTRVIDGSQSDAELWQDIMVLLMLQVRREAQQRGMLTVPNERTYGTIPTPEIFAAMEAIRARGGPVQVDAVVEKDTWTVGPLELDLRPAGADTDERVGRSPDGPPRAGG